MELLIILEEEKYLPLAEEIETSITITAAITNTDFDLTKAIKRAEAVLFLGDDVVYGEFTAKYGQLLIPKLVFTTSSVQSGLEFESELYITSRVGVCKLPVVSAELQSVIVEVGNKIFEPSLKLLFCQEVEFKPAVTSLKQLTAKTHKLALDHSSELPLAIIQKLFNTITIKTK